MAALRFTQNLQRHVACEGGSVQGATVREVLEAYFARNQAARGYVLDEHGALRHHMMIFVDGKPIGDRKALSDPVNPESELDVIQALSGG